MGVRIPAGVVGADAADRGWRLAVHGERIRGGVCSGREDRVHSLDLPGQGRRARRAERLAALGSGKFGVYFGDGQANAYGLDAVSGKELWILKVESHPNATVTAAPVVYDGRVYVPTSAVGEESRGQDPTYACCSFRGSISAIDVRTRRTALEELHDPGGAWPRGKSSAGVELLGPSGAGVWGAPTLDTKRGVLYVGTGNGYSGPPQKTMNAVIAIDLKTGAHKWVQQTVPNDVWLMQCQSQAPLKDQRQRQAGESQLSGRRRSGFRFLRCAPDHHHRFRPRSGRDSAEVGCDLGAGPR